MHHYRQHPIVLIGKLLEHVLLVLLGIGLALNLHPLLGLLALLALVLAVRSFIAWSKFRIRLRGGQLFIRSLQGLNITEQPLPFNSLATHGTKQNLPGYLLDYGTIQIETYGDAVDLRYIARFRTFTRQLDRLDHLY